MSNFQVGDQVKVHLKSAATAHGKTQVFQGLVIAIKGAGGNKTFTVLKGASAGVKVERIYPATSPLLERVEVVKKGEVRRAKLYYLRNRVRAQN